MCSTLGDLQEYGWEMLIYLDTWTKVNWLLHVMANASGWLKEDILLKIFDKQTKWHLRFLDVWHLICHSDCAILQREERNLLTKKRKFSFVFNWMHCMLWIMKFPCLERWFQIIFSSLNKDFVDLSVLCLILISFCLGKWRWCWWRWVYLFHFYVFATTVCFDKLTSFKLCLWSSRFMNRSHFSVDMLNNYELPLLMTSSVVICSQTCWNGWLLFFSSAIRLWQRWSGGEWIAHRGKSLWQHYLGGLLGTQSVL